WHTGSLYQPRSPYSEQALRRSSTGPGRRGSVGTRRRVLMSRVLLIGLDGFAPSLARRWASEGRLPNLRRIAERGALLECASTVPPATFPAWTTCVTGVNPGRHGIVDFTEMVPGQYAIRFVNGTFR